MAKSYFEVDDLLRYQLIRDLQVCPDGAEVAYELEVIDRDADDKQSGIWVVGARQDEPIELVPASSRSSMPRWSPDGSQLAFLSSRDGPAALYLLRRDGGEARKLAGFAGAITSFNWAPDGS